MVHSKRKSDDDSLCAHPSKRSRLSMVPDSSASSRLPSPASATTQSALMKCSQQSTVDSAPSQNYYHHHTGGALREPSMLVPDDSSPPPPLPPHSSGSIPSNLSRGQNPPHVDVFPPINREMLKELDIDVILRHPQLRHDFLFDSGLQFRTMNGGRKQYIADQYWDSVLHELEHDLDMQKHKNRHQHHNNNNHNNNNRNNRTQRPPTPPPWSEKHYSAYLHAATDPQVVDSPIHSTVVSSQTAFVRRVPALLRTLTEVLSYVIGSVPSERSVSLSQVLAGIDILFIDHELRRGLYEPRGLFTLMGQLLKAHCAPMRDGKIDVMMAVARGDCNPICFFGPPFSTSELLPFTDGQRSIRRTVASLRLCFEILELMKLDIANHHLHHLRPLLISDGPDFLHRAFIDKVQRGLTTLDSAQRFFNHAYGNIMSYPARPGIDSGDVEFSTSTSTAQAMLSNIRDSLLVNRDSRTNAAATNCGITRSPLENYPQGFRIHLAFIASLTDMIFNPPTFDSYVCQCGVILPVGDPRLREPVKTSVSSASSNHQQQQHFHEFKRHCSSATNQLSWPETLWLDSNRIAQLIGDAADLTALYVLLMGWRMLVFAKQDYHNSGSSSSSSTLPTPTSSSFSSTSTTTNGHVSLERVEDDRKAMPPYVKSTTFKLEDRVIDDVKKEIWSIAPRKFGSCFFWDDSSSMIDDSRNQDSSATLAKTDQQTRKIWKDGMENVALHIAMRAEHTKRDQKRVYESDDEDADADHLKSRFNYHQQQQPPPMMPSHESISLLRSWLDTHMRRSSPLTTRLRKLVAAEVASTAAKMTLHMISTSLATTTSSYDDDASGQQIPLGLSESTSTAALYNAPLFPDLRRGSIPSLLNLSPQTPNTSRAPPPQHQHHASHHNHTRVPAHNRPITIVPSPAAVSAGLEPLMPEIKHLASRIAKLTYINMKTFWSLYTAPGFLDTKSSTPMAMTAAAGLGTKPRATALNRTTTIAPLTPESTPQPEFAIKVEDD